jgi:Tfp pilus assembly protein FimV
MRPNRRLLPVVAAVGGACGLVGPASAIELGALQMDSTLGQPLRASIAFVLNPNEQLNDSCVALRPASLDGAIPSVVRATVSVSGNRIVISGSEPVMDPLLSIRLVVDCPYTPTLAREYTAIIDPVLPVDQPPVRFASSPVPESAPVVVETATESAVVVAAPRNAAPAVQAPVAMQSSYRVQTGDSVSAIAARVSGRETTLAAAVDAIVAANPDAFVDGDANRIMAGSLLVIPDMNSLAASEPDNLSDEIVAPLAEAPGVVRNREPAGAAEIAVAPVATREPVQEPVQQPVTAATAPVIEPNPVAVAEPAKPEVSPAEITADTEIVDRDIVSVADEPTSAAAADEAVPEPADVVPQPAERELRVGDIVTVPESNVEPAPVQTRSVPSVAAPVAVNTSSGERGWMSWLLYGGGGLMLLGGLFVLGRQFRERFASTPVGPTEEPARDEAETPASQPAAAVEPDLAEQPKSIVDDVDFEFDDTINSQSLSLDADLADGSGLGESGPMDVAQDFSFDAISPSDREIDLEIPEEAAMEPEKMPTDIIPPSHKIEESSILEAEVAPEPDDYDMSMIVDATRESVGDYDATAKDLQAVEIGDAAATGEYSIADDTMATEADLKALELDYEDEFTQTQALNKEIEQAARELATTLDDSAEPQAAELDLELTADMPEAWDPGLEPTAEMPARPPESEPTVEMPAKTGDADGLADLTAELTASLAEGAPADNDDVADNDITSKLAAAGGDPTVEMQVESGKIDTKKDA